MRAAEDPGTHGIPDERLPPAPYSSSAVGPQGKAVYEQPGGSPSIFLQAAKGADLTPLTSAFVTCRITFDLTCRFRMLDMRWKALDRAMNLS